MPRYSDQWLIDRTLFDYVQGGSCSCCSNLFMFVPNGTRGIIESLSELESDAKQTEINSLDKLPWPNDMKDQVWMERVRLRQYCKRNMSTYKNFWSSHGPEFETWFMTLPKSKLARYFQLPRSEPLERLRQHKFHIHASFGTVLCAVTEQVAHFHMTNYPIDGRGSSEIGFEQILTFHKRGGFTLIDDTDKTKRKWLHRHRTLGGPTLLERNAKITIIQPKTKTKMKDDDDDDSDSSSDDDGDDKDDNKAQEQQQHGGTGDADIDDDDDDDDDRKNPTNNVVPSFRSDRRIVRLLIARCFADTLQSAFEKEVLMTTENSHD